MTLILPRRSFLAAAALMAAAPMVPQLRPSAARAARRLSEGEKLGIGFIGMGIQNRYHLSWFLKREDVRVVAVCDVDKTRREDAKRFADEKYGVKAGSGEGAGAGGVAAILDYREMLARKDIDAVVIATPDHWHALQVIEACQAGKDVYCEKPMTLTLAEAKACVDAVRKHGRVFQTGSQQRSEFDGRFRKACEFVRSGRIGDVLTVHVGIGTSSKWCDLAEEPMEPGLDWDRWLGPAPVRPYNSVLSPRGVINHYPNWRLYREYSGGMMTDWGAHHFDITQWALGMDEAGPVRILPPQDPKAEYGARLMYANGVEVIHGGASGVTFQGTKGMLFVSRDALRSEPERIVKDPLGAGEVRLATNKGHIDNWLECIKSRQRPICDVEVGARSMACCILANLAYWHRKEVQWDPAKWEFAGASASEAAKWMDYERRKGFELPKV